jgi:ribosome maturation factor RimP
LVKTKKETITDIAGTTVPQLDAYLVDVTTRGERGETVVQILVDTDEGISIGHCARISKGIAQKIEEEEIFETRYRLEVSSPGLENPLRLLRQYVKNAGRIFTVKYRAEQDEATEELTIRNVDGSIIEFERPDGTMSRIEHANIIDCRHKLPW